MIRVLEHHDTSDPGGFDLDYDAWGRLVLTDAGGRQHVDVEPVRAFPFSAPEQWIAIVNAAGAELVLVEDLHSLPATTRELLLADLARREFLPVIRRITSVAPMADGFDLAVETDRGPARICLKSEDDVRRLDDGRYLIVAAGGIRYLVPDARRLDPASRRRLEQFA